MKKKADMTEGLPLSKRKQTQTAMDIPEFKATQTKERDLQRQCEEYCQVKCYPFVRIPDVAYRLIFSQKTIIPAHMRAQVSKYLKGLPDMV